MKHFPHLSEVYLDQPSIVTIGVFDGVHIGHQSLLRQLVQKAHDTGQLAAVLTLFPHPDIVLHGQKGRYYLTNPEQKARILGDLGVDIVVTHPFDESVRMIRAADFVAQLQQHLRMSSLWVTADFAMGYKREGNFAFLSKVGTEQGFEVQQIDLLMREDDGAVSSTAIREALVGGQLDIANRLLGRPYQLEGAIMHGDRRGHQLGFPTANLDIWEEQVIPTNGVYACYAFLGSERFQAVTNIGIRPTFNGQTLRVEAHLLDFNRDIYGEKLRLEFVTYLRGEQKFSGLDALVAQIQADVARGRSILTR